MVGRLFAGELCGRLAERCGIRGLGDDVLHFGAALAAFRTHRGMTRAELAERVALDVAQVVALEADPEPPAAPLGPRLLAALLAPRDVAAVALVMAGALPAAWFAGPTTSAPSRLH